MMDDYVKERVKRFIGKKTRWRLIQTYVKPHFDYASLLFIFASRSAKRKLDLMYERCLRHCMMDYTSSSESLQLSLKANTLLECWYLSLYRLMKSIERAQTEYKKNKSTIDVINLSLEFSGIAPIPLMNMFRPAQERAHRSVFEQPKFRTITYGKNSIPYFGASFWNKIPPTVRICHHKSASALRAIQNFIKQSSGITE